MFFEYRFQCPGCHQAIKARKVTRGNASYAMHPTCIARQHTYQPCELCGNRKLYDPKRGYMVCSNVQCRKPIGSRIDNAIIGWEVGGITPHPHREA